LAFEGSRFVSVSWSHFDRLWIAADCSLPIDVVEDTVRWVPNSIGRLDELFGSKVKSVRLGRGEMSIADTKFEIWTRLFIEIGDRWLEVFNNLDENGYEVHSTISLTETILCV
jgi:hypothetical protein